MLALKVSFKDAEKMRRLLIEKALFDSKFEIAKDTDSIYFPIVKKFAIPEGSIIVSKALALREGKKDWKGILIERKILTKKDSQEMASSFDSMGGIAVMEIPDGLTHKERKIGAIFLECHPNFKTVAKKTSAVKGEFRVKGLKVIAGKKSLVTTYKESGGTFEIDLGKVYFSPRLSFERERIASQVRKGENVLALFAGAGFYPVIIAKKQPKCKIVAIELNPIGVKFMEKNVRSNKVENQIKVIEGDVKKVLLKPKFKGWASRAIMPLPHLAHEFLGDAINSTAKNGIIHFYHIPKGEMPDAFGDAGKKVFAACKKAGRKFRIISRRVVKTYAPHVDEVVVDFKLTN